MQVHNNLIKITHNLRRQLKDVVTQVMEKQLR